MTPISIRHLIVRHASRSPEDGTLEPGLTTSYGELWQQICAVSDRLRAAGQRPDDRVAVYIDNRPETGAAIFAATLAGGAVAR